MDEGPAFATGVTGKERVPFADMAERTLVRENALDVEGLSCCPSEDGVPGMRRIVLSLSGFEFFALKLRCGSRFLIDDFVLEEVGLGGSPALVEPGVSAAEGIFIRVEVGNGVSKDLAGICKEGRFGRLD